MKSINIVYKQIWIWLTCCQEIPNTLVAQKLQNLAGINTYEKIHLIQACIYHDYCKTLSKGH